MYNEGSLDKGGEVEELPSTGLSLLSCTQQRLCFCCILALNCPVTKKGLSYWDCNLALMHPNIVLNVWLKSCLASPIYSEHLLKAF